MAVRRSTRERKQPTLFSVDNTRREQKDDETNDSQSESEDDAQDETFAPQVQKESKKKAKEATKKTVAKRKAASTLKSRATKKTKDTDERDGKVGNKDELLLDAVRLGGGVMRDDIEAWRDRYDEDADAATRELFNFSLQACGGNGICLPSDIAIEDLDYAELTERVATDLDASTDTYPLASKRKGHAKFHRNLSLVWKELVKQSFDSELLFTTSLISRLVEWLTAFSSSDVRALRHTMTFGAYAVASALVMCASTTSEQLETANRQLKAASTKNSKSKRTTVLEEDRDLHENRLEQLNKLAGLVYRNVFMHRYRDVSPDIRKESVVALCDWIQVLPDQFLQGNVLKYIGWLLSDRSSTVRLACLDALKELYTSDENAEALVQFTSHFSSRFVEMCKDVDAAVVRSALELLVIVDRQKLLDEDVDVQDAEKLVFDPSSREVRRAAAAFVCMQYDAFVGGEKLSREQQTTQAIAFVQFAEDCMDQHEINPRACKTLVDAFWDEKTCPIVRDWRLLSNLLLFDKNAPDFTREQQTILLRVLVSVVEKTVSGESRPLKSADDKRRWEEDKADLSQVFYRALPELLTQYDAEEDKLSLLLELLPILSKDTSVIGNSVEQVKALVERLQQSFLAHSNVHIVTSIVSCLRHISKTEHEVVKRETESALQEVTSEVVTRTLQLLEDDAEIHIDLVHGKHAKIPKRQRQEKRKTVADVQFALQASLLRLQKLCQFWDVRTWLSTASASPSEDMGDVTSEMDTIGSELVALVRRRTKDVVALDETLLQSDTLASAVKVLYFDLLWQTSPVFQQLEAIAKKLETSTIEEKSSDADQITHEADDSVRNQLTGVYASRKLLEQGLSYVLEMRLGAPDSQSDDQFGQEVTLTSDEQEAFVQGAQKEAFMTFCDTCCLLVEKLQQTPEPYKSLHWTVPSRLAMLWQLYFTREMSTEASEENTKDKTERHKAELLVALGKVSACNPSRQHQASTLLLYFTSDEAPTLNVVKAFAKQLKTNAPPRYLEYQMSALRDSFSSVLELEESLQAFEDDDEDKEAVQKQKEDAQITMEELSKRFSRSLGVGKVSQPLRRPLSRFLMEGVRFSMQVPETFAFLEPLKKYVHLIDAPSARQIRAYFEQLVQRHRDAPGGDELEESDEWRVVTEFREMLAKKDRRPKQSEKSKETPATPAGSNSSHSMSNVGGQPDTIDEESELPTEENAEDVEEAREPSEDEAAVPSKKRVRRRL